ncbi:unnamed protein product [Durusdinium trenchii]|uniref:Nucleotide-diphospho-sugar transferase domain-containing protein n=1 Tax=Durusdinium trenchii TaxID=1381693 RepID=A0ABP0NTS1_9DINO
MARAERTRGPSLALLIWAGLAGLAGAEVPVLAELPSGELPDIDCLDVQSSHVDWTSIRYHAWEFDAHWQAPRPAVLAQLRDRGEALLRVLTLADQKAVGLMACQMETLTRRSDICGCDGGPGGMGLQEFDLGFDQRSLKRFWGNNGSELVDLVTKVSRCVTLSVYERPTAVSESYSRGSKQHIIALGTRKQRWMAAELLRMIVYTTIEKWLGRVPAKLGGECCLLTLPGQALTQFFGYRQRHYRDLMHETNTIIVPVQQNKGGIEKKDIDEVEDFIANMMEADDPFEIAIFGEPLAQSIVLVKLYALVERKVPGFVIRSGQSEEQIDPSDGVGIDKIRLTFDFQEDATNKKAEILSEAAGCYAACIGNLLLLAGHLKNRQRAREYAQFLAPKQRTTGGKFPYVHDVDVRADMMATWVPEDASKSKWFKDRLKSLMEEGKMCAFFDDCTNDNGERRLIFAGIRVENEEEKEAVMEVVTKTQDLAKDAVDWIHERYKSIDSSQEWSSWKRRRTMVSSTLTKQEDKPSDPVDSEHWNQGREENSMSSSSWSSWSNWQNPSDEPTSASSGLRVPQTPAGFGPHGNTAPHTPMPAARGAPRTPAGFGPYGLSAPQTPALPAASAAAWRPKEPDSRAAVPPPATPARPAPASYTSPESLPHEAFGWTTRAPDSFAECALGTLSAVLLVPSSVRTADCSGQTGPGPGIFDELWRALLLGPDAVPLYTLGTSTWPIASMLAKWQSYCGEDPDFKIVRYRTSRQEVVQFLSRAEEATEEHLMPLLWQPREKAGAVEVMLGMFVATTLRPALNLKKRPTCGARVREHLPGSHVRGRCDTHADPFAWPTCAARPLASCMAELTSLIAQTSFRNLTRAPTVFAVVAVSYFIAWRSHDTFLEVKHAEIRRVLEEGLQKVSGCQTGCDLLHHFHQQGEAALRTWWQALVAAHAPLSLEATWALARVPSHFAVSRSRRANVPSRPAPVFVVGGAHGPIHEQWILHFLHRAADLKLRRMIFVTAEVEWLLTCEDVRQSRQRLGHLLCVRVAHPFAKPLHDKAKFYLFPLLLSLGMDIVSLDLDVFLFKDPTAKLLDAVYKKDPLDMAVMDHFDGTCLNAGVLVVRASDRALLWVLQYIQWMHVYPFGHLSAWTPF